MMKIKIKENVAELYIAENMDLDGNYYGNAKWESFLWELAGKLLEVVNYDLLGSTFDTKPIKGLTSKGFTIPKEYIQEVIYN
ncbi:hypothetical protein [Desertibacillus haloalkaliphilus]|uniref:hypothetical protein n=1 Tax=Desertibacillus haloalkaliphilus TaxID=1328930 RepID=UPI001C265D44|nr:hypothetical protein [Desertibacillus haloalkaliphilus]MBU8909002.1 hypothetical protein [Desertibacillus haloalkaliphilus]